MGAVAAEAARRASSGEAVAPAGQGTASLPATADKRRRAQTAGGVASTASARTPYGTLPPAAGPTTPLPARSLALPPPRVTPVPAGRPLVSPKTAESPGEDGARAQQAEGGEGRDDSADRWLITVNGHSITQLLARVRELGYSGHAYLAARAGAETPGAASRHDEPRGDAALGAALAQSDAVTAEAERTIRGLSGHYGRDASGRVAGGGGGRAQATFPGRDAQRAFSAVQRTLSRAAPPAPGPGASSDGGGETESVSRAAADMVAAYQDAAPTGWEGADAGPSSGDECLSPGGSGPRRTQTSALPGAAATPHGADIYDSFTGPGRRLRALVSPRPSSLPQRPRAGQQRPPRRATPRRRGVKTERGRAERPEVDTPYGWRSASPGNEQRPASRPEKQESTWRGGDTT